MPNDNANHFAYNDNSRSVITNSEASGTEQNISSPELTQGTTLVTPLTVFNNGANTNTLPVTSSTCVIT